jgi:uncharacterized protein YcbX
LSSHFCIHFPEQMSITLSEINIYPIKACGGVSPMSWELEQRGLRHDRRWMVVDGDGVFMTQRDFPRMTLIAVEVRAGHLNVGAPNMQSLLIPFETRSDNHIPVVVWDDRVKALEVGGDAAEWFSEYLGVACKLVVMSDRSIRPVNQQYAVGNDVVSFADGFPLLLISESSLADLNSRLTTPVTMKRFRPNIVVKGCAPFAEDGWKEIAVGGVHLHIVKPCARCTVPTVDLKTGEKSAEPLRTLATFRSVGNKVLFGQNVIHATNGRLHVGDEVRVVR